MTNGRASNRTSVDAADGHDDFRNGPSSIVPENELNPTWPKSERGRKITVRKSPIIRPDSKFFTMGSCFARELRVALRDLGYNVYPKYFDLAFDPERQKPNMLPSLDNINHYDTFVMRQEIERALTLNYYRSGDFWKLSNTKMPWTSTYCDPYRRKIFAADMDSLSDLSAKLTDCIAQGLESADILVLTLGLTECWINKANGLFVCQGPSKKKDDEIRDLAEFYNSTFDDNYNNLKIIIDRVTEHYPDKQIVLTVSPVALHRTATDEDIVVANMTSKTTLRAVAGQLCRECPQVIYWPSYEFAMAEDVFEEDGRHVTPTAVKRIVGSFLDAYGSTKPPIAATTS